MTQFRPRFGHLFVFAPGLVAFATEDSPTAAPRSQRLERVVEFVAEQQKTLGLPSLSAAVALNHELAWSGSFGLADLEHSTKATTKTVYRMGAVSKLITAVAVLQLVQGGRISMFESIRDYAPEFPDKGAPINVRHVLAHLSGIRGFKEREETRSSRHFAKLTDALEGFKGDALAAQPGERFINSSPAYNLLGLLIERVSGLSYAEYLDEHVFRPAGMVSARLDDVEAIVAHRARSYVRRAPEEFRNAPLLDLSISYPGEGLLATAEDLARFAAALDSGVILSAELLQVMTTVHKTTAGTDEQYGLGCFSRTEDGRRIYGHGGWPVGSSAFLLILPDQDAAIVLLANLDRVDLRQMSLTIARMLFDEPPPEAAPKPVP